MTFDNLRVNKPDGSVLSEVIINDLTSKSSWDYTATRALKEVEIYLLRQELLTPQLESTLQDMGEKHVPMAIEAPARDKRKNKLFDWFYS